VRLCTVCVWLKRCHCKEQISHYTLYEQICALQTKFFLDFFAGRRKILVLDRMSARLLVITTVIITSLACFFLQHVLNAQSVVPCATHLIPDILRNTSRHQVEANVPAPISILPKETLLTTSVSLIQFPAETKNVIINIGSNVDPPLPPADDPSTVVIAGEFHCTVQDLMKVCLQEPGQDRVHMIIVCHIIYHTTNDGS
jgi:hypothetical protein